MTGTKPLPKSAVTQPADNLPKSTAVSSPPAVRRPDWQLFCSLNGLQQRAGVPVRDLPKLVCKELTDNALDAAEAAGGRDGCDLGFVGDDGLWMGGCAPEEEAVGERLRPRLLGDAVRKNCWHLAEVWGDPGRSAAPLGHGCRTRNLRNVGGPLLAMARWRHF